MLLLTMRFLKFQYARCKSYLSLALVAVILVCCFSCSVKWQLKRANTNYEQQAYSRASERYLKLLKKSGLKQEEQQQALFHLAECFRLTGDAHHAEIYYRRLTTRGNANPGVLLGLAKSQQAGEKYAAAAATYEKYLQLAPQDTLVQQMLEACAALRDSLVDSTRYLVDNVGDFNSNKDDFSPAFAEDDYSALYFTSSREAALGKKKNIVTGNKSSDIFFSKQSRNGRWEKPLPVTGEINTKAEEGACSFTPNLRTMYFTQCLARGSKIGCSIFTTTRDEENVWTSLNRVNLFDSTFNVAHPALSEDGVEMYFASDMEGGYGGFDIWVVNRLGEGEEWSEPVNMGATINTAGDEMYPYARSMGTLYFSSNGHKGFGGLDIFKATQKEQGGWQVENMGMPINSSADDFSIIFEKEREAGYFASRRKGGKGGDDIYRFVLPEAKYMFIGSVRDFEDAKPIDDANVKTISSNGDIMVQKTAKDGLFSLQLQPETDYLVVVTKPGFFNQKAKFSTKGLETITTLRDDFRMRTMAKSIELENILYDLGKWDLRPESEESLNQLVEVLNDNPDISIEISSHSDSRGDSTFNLNLSQKRAQSVVDYVVAKGIDASRLQAKGYGETTPRIVTKALATQHKFLPEGSVLDDKFIRQHVRNIEEEEIVDQLNRRTEFKVISATQ
ncbi:MAG: OmpA family protein [Prevotellaceae bacterium]|jgi:peptidoglycan-associated lipoprotein|nr:OmpA family protein [Prevotellaceae bacterium]